MSRKFGKFTFHGNPYIGLFARTNNKLTIVPVTAPDKFSRMADFLETKWIKLSLAQSDLVGMFSVMNDNGIALSIAANDNEVVMLKQKIKEMGIDLNVSVLSSRYTAVGNNIVANNNGVLINENTADGNTLKELRDIFGVEVATVEGVAGYATVGSAVAATNKGFVAHPSITEEEINIIKSVLKVDGGIGTINGGVPFVGLGIVANDNVALVGEKTTGFEIHRVDESLGLIK